MSIEYNLADQVIRKRGRPRGLSGSAAKRAEEAKEIASRLGFSPFEFLLRVARNRRIDMELRIRAAAESCRYLHPRLANSQVNSHVSHVIEHQVIHAIMLDPKKAAMAQELALAMVTEQNKIAAEGPVLQIEPAEPDSAALIESSEDSLLFFPEGTPSHEKYDESEPGEDLGDI